MARTTLASLSAENAALRTQLEELRAMVLRPQSKARWTKNAALVYVDKQPFYTAFTHSEAYRLMRAAQNAGLSAMYVPVRA